MTPNLPFVSVVTLTFGRPHMLEEAIECFLRQDYEGPKEMVVFNSLPGQKLMCSAPNVKIINHPMRPSSLGECRNLCINQASGTHCLTLDDDDIILPHYMRMCVDELVKHDLDWVKVGGLIWSVNRTITEVRGPAANQFLYSKDIWQRIGKYPKMGCGEDRVFEERLVAQGKGFRVEKPPSEAGYMYGWGNHSNSVFHASQNGEDKGSIPHSYIKVGQFVQQKMRARKLRYGIVQLKPGWRIDYAAAFKQFCANKNL